MNHTHCLLRALLLLALTCAFVSCDTNHDPEEDPYISFYPGITTRGELKNTFAKGDAIGISRYCYVYLDQNTPISGTSDWDTKNIHITPKGFHNVKYDWNGAILESRQREPWSGNARDKYSFFAYYPHNLNNSRIELSSESYTGAPYLIFNQDFKRDYKGLLSHNAMVDVMAAFTEDHMSTDGPVPFLFHHLLSCVDFAVANLNQESFIRLKRLDFSGSFIEKAKFALDSFSMLESVRSQNGHFSLITGNDYPLVSPTLSSGKLYYVTNDQKNNHLLLIPQIRPADWKVSIDWEIVRNNQVLSSHTLKDQSFGSNIELKPGKRHLFTLDFLGDICVIKAQTGASWEGGDDIDIEFE